jgi:hypothetical protein
VRIVDDLGVRIAVRSLCQADMAGRHGLRLTSSGRRIDAISTRARRRDSKSARQPPWHRAQSVVPSSPSSKLDAVSRSCPVAESLYAVLDRMRAEIHAAPIS